MHCAQFTNKIVRFRPVWQTMVLFFAIGWFINLSVIGFFRWQLFSLLFDSFLFSKFEFENATFNCTRFQVSNLIVAYSLQFRLGCRSNQTANQFERREMYPSVFKEVFILRRRPQQAQEVHVRLCIRRVINTRWSLPNHNIAAHQRRAEGIQCRCIRLWCNWIRYDWLDQPLVICSDNEPNILFTGKTHTMLGPNPRKAAETPISGDTSQKVTQAQSKDGGLMVKAMDEIFRHVESADSPESFKVHIARFTNVAILCHFHQKNVIEKWIQLSPELVEAFVWTMRHGGVQ